MLLPFHMQDSKVKSSASGEAMDSASTVSNDSEPSLDYTTFKARGRGLASSISISRDGRLSVALNIRDHKLSDFKESPTSNVQPQYDVVDHSKWRNVPAMSVVIMVVGSRGDVQPYVALAKELLQDGHRVRIATHATFEDFVRGHGLEFFNIGGDPHELMSYMVKNPGLMPGMASLTQGDISKKRKMLKEIIHGCWFSCFTPDQTTGKAFAADAIISNPPAFAHIHCAEALGVPLILSFSETTTSAFPHPLVHVTSSNAGNGLTNTLSYGLADILTWQGVGDLINKFRVKTLGLDPLTLRLGSGYVELLKVPWTFCMSPALVPKPIDWKAHIDVVGFYFLDLASDFIPPSDLAKFLDSGPPPIYIGFGSVVIDDPETMTRVIFEATEMAGVRALVSAGWAGLGSGSVPPHIFILGNTPHDWLFANERVSACIHHGGAGTTAIGLANGRPTAVVPFFGDQAFWGDMIHNAGAGPQPIPHKSLNVKNLTEAIQFLLRKETRAAARRLAQSIRDERGAQRGVNSFYRHLPLLNMRCDLDQTKVAAWWSPRHCMKLSAFAAQVLVNEKVLDPEELIPHRAKTFDAERRAALKTTPSGGTAFWDVTEGINDIVVTPVTRLVKLAVSDIPGGVMRPFVPTHKFLNNLPAAYGSEVRQPGQIKGFASGLKEGGKSLYFGCVDGVTALYKEPIRGAREEGFVGFLKGSGRSYIDVAVKPVAGAFGFIAHPVQGIWKFGRSSALGGQLDQFQASRQAVGFDATKGCTMDQRERIISMFTGNQGGSQKRSVSGAPHRAEDLARPSGSLMSGSYTDDQPPSYTDSIYSPPRRSFS